MGDEGCFPLITILDVNIVIPSTNIKFCEVTSVFQLIDQVGDKGEGVYILSSMFIEVLVILARMEFAILLLNKEERRHLRGVQRMDLPSS